MLSGTMRSATTWRSVLSTACLVLCINSYASAYTMTVSSDAYIQTMLKRHAQEGRIHVEHLPRPPMLNDLARRSDVSSSSVSSTTISTSSKSTSSSSSSTTSQSSNSTIPTSSRNVTSSSATSATATYTATTLPQPFDTSLGNNFTSTSCPTFFNSFLSNSTFKACLPISLLLQNSLSFFQAVRSPNILTETLDTSCAASLAICSPLMSSIAANLISSSNCGDDYTKQNPIVSQAYAGLMAYEPMYKASCLKDPNNSTQYCFAEALTNSSASSDSYPYYTAIGIELPISATPSCTPCLQDTMAIFAGYAKMKEQPLSTTYLSCATHIDATCGASFANQNVQVATTKGKSSGADALYASRPVLAVTMAILSLAALSLF